jgi:hypothetical protein
MCSIMKIDEVDAFAANPRGGFVFQEVGGSLIPSDRSDLRVDVVRSSTAGVRQVIESP